jgi:hypothetical protein
MLADKVECLALSFDDSCKYYVIVPTMSGVKLEHRIALIVKERLQDTGTIIE